MKVDDYIKQNWSASRLDGYSMYTGWHDTIKDIIREVYADAERMIALELQAENEKLRKTLNDFFKVIEIGGKQYSPSIKACGGCPHITIARGWECYYKRDTTECEYPKEFIAALEACAANKRT